jgi:hypothetical protein
LSFSSKIHHKNILLHDSDYTSGGFGDMIGLDRFIGYNQSDLV